MKFARLALIAVGLSFASSSYAMIQAKRCVGCTTDSQWETVAAQQTFGNHYLYNFPGGEIRLYKKERVPIGSQNIAIDPWGIDVLRLGVPPRVQATFDAATQLWAISPTLAESDTMRLDPSDPNLPGGLGDANAFDVVAATALQNRLAGYIDAQGYNSPFLQFLQSVAAGSYVGIKFDNTLVTYELRVTFSDGSSVVIRADLTHGQQAYYVEGQSRDSNDNAIVEPGETSTNTFYFDVDPNGFNDWRNYTRNVLGWGLLDGTYCARYTCHSIVIGDAASQRNASAGNGSGSSANTNLQMIVWQCDCALF